MNTRKKPTLRELYKFRDRVKREILGEDDKEYRAELEFLLQRTNAKIKEVHKEQDKL